MLTIEIKDIPRETSLVLDLETIEASELKALFDGVEEFETVDPEGFEAKVRLQMIGDTIRVSGYVAAKVAFECGRCLEHRVVDMDAEMEYILVSRDEYERTYVVPDRADDDEEGIQLSQEDLDVAYYEGEYLDLRPYLREALLLELPPFAVCPEEMMEQCRLDFEKNVGEEAIESNEENAMDPRWSKLLELKKKGEFTSDEEKN